MMMLMLFVNQLNIGSRYYTCRIKYLLSTPSPVAFCTGYNLSTLDYMHVLLFGATLSGVTHFAKTGNKSVFLFLFFTLRHLLNSSLKGLVSYISAERLFY